MYQLASKTLSLTGLVLGLGAWLIFAAGSLYAPLALSPNCSPGEMFPPRLAAQLTSWQTAWWFALAGLPIAVLAVVLNFRLRPSWVAVAVNVLFWVLVWGWLYGDVATCPYR